MIGIVKWYDSDKGYGVLEGDDEREYFIHFSNQVNRKQRFYENDILVFQPSLENNRLSAKKAEPFLDPISYQHIISEHDTHNNTNIGPINFIKQINKYISKQNDIVKRGFSKINRIVVHNLIMKEFESYKFLETKAQITELGYVINSHIDKYVLAEEDINWLKTLLATHIRSHSSPENKVQVYLLGYLDSLPDEEIISQFNEAEIADQVLLLIKSKDQPTLQETLIEGHIGKHGIRLTFTLLQDYFNKARPGWFSAKHLYDKDYWKYNEGKSLRDIFVDYCKKIEDPKKQCDLYLQEFLQKPNIDYLILNPTYYDQNQLNKLFKTGVVSNDDIYKCLINRIGIVSEINAGKYAFYNHLKENNSLAIQFLEPSSLEKYNIFFNDIFTEDQLIDAWLKDLVPEFPLKVFLNKLLPDVSVYKAIAEKFIRNRNKIDLLEILLQRLQLLHTVSVDDRPSFYNKYWTIHTLFFLDQSPERSKYSLITVNHELIHTISAINNQFYELILWSFDFIQEFEFASLREKFIYFSPKDQLYLFRKLIWLKSNGNINISIDDLQSIKRISYDIYKINEKLNNDIGLDLTIDLVITCLYNFNKDHSFYFERNIFNILFANTEKYPTYTFQIKEIFETCKGRSTPKFKRRTLHDSYYTIIRACYADDNAEDVEYVTGNEIEDPEIDNNFIVKFPYDETMVSDIKRIPGARWDKEEKYWTIPSSSETQLIEFGRERDFTFKITNNSFRDNYHFVRHERKEVPTGITFCEGRLANKKDDLSGKDFYWCCNNKCHDLSETKHENDTWENYNFLDICRIFNLNVDEHKHDEVILNGEYYKLTGQINRFNRLLSRMHCLDCNHLLHPVESSEFAFYRVIRFHCQNSRCNNRSIIYLHHCFNGKCNSIIDSRVSKQCSNKWYICETCTSCCSHRSNATRLKNLETTGGYIHPELKRQVDTHAGHWEKNQHFCYRDSSQMIDEGTNQFKCPRCALERDITPYLTLRERAQDET